MLGDMRVFDLGDELLLDCERVALQELFNMINRYKLGRDVELHKRTLQLGAAVRDRTGRARARRRRPSTTTRASTLGGAAVIAVTTDVGTDLFFAPDDRDAVRGALDFPDGDEAQAEIVRVEHGRPRYGVDLDDSVIPQEAGLNERAVSFTKGCYVGPGDGRAALLPRQAEPAPARAAAGRAGRARDRAAAGREGRRQARLGGRLAATTGRSALALVRREANPGDTVAVDGSSALIVDVPFAR